VLLGLVLAHRNLVYPLAPVRIPLSVNAYSITSPQNGGLATTPDIYLHRLVMLPLWGGDNTRGNIRERGNLGIESWEEQLNDNNSSNEKTSEPAAGKKLYKTPTLRFESVFEVSALSCGKLTSTQSGCNFVQKAS
jgi:hypothetical protein